MIINHSVYEPMYRNEDKFIVLVTGGRGCETPDTLMRMYDGSIRYMRDLKVGEQLMGDDGTPRTIEEIVSGRSTLYRVCQSYGRDYIVNDAHILYLYNLRMRCFVEMTMFEYMGCGYTRDLRGVVIENGETILTDIRVYQMTEGEYMGVHIDGNHRYLGTDGTVKRNSGKSVAASTFIERLTFELGKAKDGHKIAHQILYTRYTMASAGMSIIPELMDKIEADGTSKYFRKSGKDIENVMTGARIMFRGIRTSSGNQTAKLKSIKGLTIFVCDEAEEFVSEDDYEKIVFSIRQQGLRNLVIIIMNPSDSNHFIYQKYIKDTHKLVNYNGTEVQISTHPNVLHIHTSYLDNKEYLAPQFIEEAEAMKKNNRARYDHIFMGRWSDVAEGAVFKKWGIVKEFPDYCKKVALCADWGYTNDVTAILMCGIVDNRLYIKEICYKSAMLSSDIIKEVRPYAEEGLFIYSESADPRLIDEIALGGIVIYPVSKGPGSIKAGIDKMLTMEIFVTEDSLNAQEELRNYKWAKDKDGRYLNEPEDAYNHCFPRGTMVSVDGEDVDIADIKVGDLVNTSVGLRKVTQFFDQGVRETIKVRMVTTEGTAIEIESTPDHKVKTSEGWLQIKEIKAGNKIYLLKSSANAVTYCCQELAEITIIGRDRKQVYDIEVDEAHEFFANGVLVHNCMDAARYYVLSVLLGKVMKPKKVTKQQLGIF